MTKFEKITVNAIGLLENATEVLIAWNICRLLDSVFIGIISFLALSFSYSCYALKHSNMTLQTWDIDKGKEIIIQFQPYWLVINTIVSIVLSWID